MEEIKQDIKIDFLKTAMKWAGEYANDMKLVEEMVYKSEPYRMCVCDIYKKFVDIGELISIEKIDQSDKQELFNESRRLFPEVKSDLHRKQLCIFLYFMNFVFEKYFVA